MNRGFGEPGKKYLRFILIGLALCFFIILILLLYRYNFIPHKKYTNEDFHIEARISSLDEDGDGVDNQTDLLESARAYLKTKPKYKSKYYDSGYPDDGYGVCTDVVGFAMKGAGFDLQRLVAEDVAAAPEAYAIEEADDKIDFRRVRNLKVFFKRNAISLTTDPKKIEEWQGGDIVIFKNHIGIVSDKRNKRGIAFVLHNGSSLQRSYEEDILESWGEIAGHYRIE